MSKLTELAKSEGMTLEGMLEEATLDGVCPGICRNCDYTTEVEPDQDKGWCENCNTNTVVSCLILAGLI